MKVRYCSFSLLLTSLICQPLVFDKENPSPASRQDDERIVTREEVQDVIESPAMIPIRVISFPFRAVTGGMEKGLIKVERDHLRERLRLWTDRLREMGITGLFG